MTRFRSIPTGPLAELNTQIHDVADIETAAVRAFGPGAVIGPNDLGWVEVYVGGLGKVGEVHPVPMFEVVGETVATMDATGEVELTEHEHDWQLTEDGYTRTWGTVVFDNDGTIVQVIATHHGSEDWSEGGDGEYLLCTTCGERRDAPANITWQ